MSDATRRPKMFEYDWWHPLTWIAGISFVAAIISIGLLAYKPNSTSLAFLSSILTLIASSLISHLVTYSNERKQFSRHLAKFSAFAKRRVELLCTDLNLLSIEIADTADLKEAKQIVLYALKNLEQDAKASVRDIDDMRKIDEDDDIQSEQLIGFAKTTIDESKLLPDSRYTAVQEKVAYTCSHCGYSNSTSLSTLQGATKHVECANCRTRLTLHRASRGAIRVVNPATRVRARKSLPDLTNPVEAEHPTLIPSPSSRGVEHSHIQDSFLCPRCQHRIRFSASPDEQVVERPCFSCLSIVEYDRRDRIARVLTDRKPIYVASLDDASEMICSNCKKSFVPRIYRSEDGKSLVCCFSCNTIYLPDAYRKKVVEKTCPTEGCENKVGFKVDDTTTESRQFCFECMSRLVYRRASDEVAVLQKLNVPQITFAEFDDGGRLCPNCHSAASGRYTMNSRGQKLSICWNCKNVFELIENRSIIPLRKPETRQ